MTVERLELICPAGTPAALRAAVDAGADAVYCGFSDETNARNFPGLNFSRAEMAGGVAYAAAQGAKVLVAINTFPRAGAETLWRAAVDDAFASGAYAVILADLGLLTYAAERHANRRLHLSVQAAAANADAVNFYAEAFGVKRVVRLQCRKSPPSIALSMLKPKCSFSADFASWRRGAALFPPTPQDVHRT